MVTSLLHVVAYDSNSRVASAIVPVLRAHRIAPLLAKDSRGNQIFEVLPEYFTYSVFQSPNEWPNPILAFIYIQSMGSDYRHTSRNHPLTVAMQTFICHDLQAEVPKSDLEWILDHGLGQGFKNTSPECRLITNCHLRDCPAYPVTIHLLPVGELDANTVAMGPLA